MFVPMRSRIRSTQWTSQKHLTAHARETESLLGANQVQQQMIARIPTRGEADIKSAAKFSQLQKLAPWPGPKPILVLECRPRCDEGNHFDIEGESRLQIVRKRLRQKRHVELFRRRAHKRHGNNQVA